jgi:hypothetical protein
MASAESISDRCEMLLSPGTLMLPDNGGALPNVMERG